MTVAAATAAMTRTSIAATPPSEPVDYLEISRPDEPWLWSSFPDAARARLASLRLKQDEARAAASIIQDQINEQFERKNSADARLRHIARSSSDPRDPEGRLPDDSPQVKAEVAKRDLAAAEIARLKEVEEVRSARRNEIGRLVERLERYCREHLVNRRDIATWTGPTAKVAKGEAFADAIERRRRRLRELEADAHAVRSAPIHSAVAKARVRADIEARSARAAPELRHLLESERADVRWPMQGTQFIAGKHYNSPDIDGAALVFWLFRDQLIERAEAEIDALADDAAALTRQQREAKLAEIAADRLAVEREECALIELAAADGLNMSYRTDTDPRAILSLSSDLPAPVEPW